MVQSPEPVVESSEPAKGNVAAVASSSADEPARILVALPSWVGDLVLATPTLRALRDRFPRAQITGLLRGYMKEILDGGDWLDDVVSWPRQRNGLKSAGPLWRLGRELRQRRFDWAVLLTNSFRSALLARLAGIPRRIGYDRDGRGLLLTDRLQAERRDGQFVPAPMIGYYNAIARYLGCDAIPTRPELFTTAQEEQTVTDAIAAVGVGADQPIVVLNPGASFGSAKRWLPERFAAVADALVERHRAAVFVSCGPNELDTAYNVAAHMKRPVTVLDEPVMRLGPVKALIRRASLVITNDTGPRHFANAFGTPVVTIYGPTDPRWTLTEVDTERSLMIKVDCGPCMKRECPLDHRCMTGVSSDWVLAEAEALLSERLASSHV